MLTTQYSPRLFIAGLETIRRVFAVRLSSFSSSRLYSRCHTTSANNTILRIVRSPMMMMMIWLCLVIMVDLDVTC